jgi:thiamine biosynthesis protein ThiS
MNLTINGEPQVSTAETLGALVETLGMKPDRVAIELNREIVPREQWPQTPLHEGDRLEIVHFVGGGSEFAGRKRPATLNKLSSPSRIVIPSGARDLQFAAKGTLTTSLATRFATC